LLIGFTLMTSASVAADATAGEADRLKLWYTQPAKSAMNEALQRLMLSDAPLTPEDRALLEDYFNLCAEEYLYRTYGIIDERVWRAWCRGMLQYLADDRVAEFWNEEESRGSYYGLTLTKIEKGAGPVEISKDTTLSEQDSSREAA